MKEQKEQSVTSKTVEINLILGILVVVAAFLIGSMWTKSNYLNEKAMGTEANPGANTAQAEQQAIPAPKKPEITDQDHFLGNPNAQVVLVEYSDFECPFCKNFHSTVQEIVKTYPNEVKFIYRHFPLPFHQNAQKAAEASECIAKLAGNEGFWKFTDLYFEKTEATGTGFPLEKFKELAKEAGADPVAFQNCLDSDEMAQKVREQMAKGQEEGVSGTPGTILINAKGETKLIEGALSFEQIKPMIDEALKS